MRAYIINRQIDDIRGTLFRQTMFAEFEKIIHAIEERGEALTLDVFKTEYRKLLEAYFGRAWCSIPSSISNACASRIFTARFTFTNMRPAFRRRSRWPSGCSRTRRVAVEAYLGFLKSGGSKFPLETLQMAGVDMTTSAPVESTLRLFERRLGELEQRRLPVDACPLGGAATIRPALPRVSQSETSTTAFAQAHSDSAPPRCPLFRARYLLLQSR